MKKSFPWFEAALVVVFLGVQIYAALADAYAVPNAWFIRDDAYYYFKVAKNLSEGLGSTFDGIHSTNGYHPLWMLLCIPVFSLARFDLILPLRILLVLMSALSLGTAILLYRLIKNSLSPAAGIVAAIYWSFDSYTQGVFYQTGLESGLALFFIVLLIYQLQELEKDRTVRQSGLKKIALLALTTALAILSRLDLVFFGAIIGIWVIFRNLPLRYLLPFDLLAICAAVPAAFIFRLGLPAYYTSSNSAVLMVIAALFVKIPLFYSFGLYRSPSVLNLSTILSRSFPAVALGSIAMAIVLMAGSSFGIFPEFSRAILIFDALATLGFVLIVRLAAYRFYEPSNDRTDNGPLEDLRRDWKSWLKEGAVFYGISGGLLGLYMLWSRLAFGTFTPVSGQIKRWWASSAINIYGSQASSLTEFLGLDPNAELNAWPPVTARISLWYNYIFHTYHWAYPLEIRHRIYPILLVLFCIAILAALLVCRRRITDKAVRVAALPLFVGSWLQILSYSITGYASPKEWYWLTEQLFIVLLGALIVNLFFELLPRRSFPSQILIWILVGWFNLPMVYRYGRDIYLEMPHGRIPADAAYMQVVPFLEDHTRPGDVIGMTGGGNVGYFIQARTIVNMDGLINSYNYFLALKDGSSADYLYGTGMRYVFASPYLLGSAPYRGQYTGRLVPVIDWGGKELMQLLPTSAR